MAEVTAAMIKELRERTGAGMSDCKKALTECEADVEKAAEYLRKKGLAAAAKKAGRIASEGLVGSYIHSNGRIGVLVEIGCETDFVAGTDEFKQFAHEIALQISASADARWVSREDVPADLIESELDIYRTQAADKPENVRDKIAQGKLDKWLSSVVLLEQPYVRDGDKTVDDLRTEIAHKTGENVQIKRFTRYERGS